MKPKPTADPEAAVFAVDVANLDVEWTKQAKRYKRYADRLADAKLAMNTAKADLDLAAAEVEMQVRRNPVAFHLDKVTDKVIEACVCMHGKYKTALAAHNRARYEVDVLTGAVSALDHKKKALELLFQMWSMSYFADPKTSAGTRQVQKKMARAKGPGGIPVKS